MSEYSIFVLVYRGEYDEHITKEIENCAGITYFKHLVVFSDSNNATLFTINSSLVVTISHK